MTRAHAHCSGPIRLDLGNPPLRFLPCLLRTDVGLVFQAPIPRLYPFCKSHDRKGDRLDAALTHLATFDDMLHRIQLIWIKPTWRVV